MKKFSSFFLGIFLFVASFGGNYIYATTTPITDTSSKLLDISNYNPTKLDQSLTVRQLLFLYFNIIGEGIPASYQYIKLEFTNVPSGSLIYDALQKGVYLDLVKNRPVPLALDKTASEDIFAKMIQTNFEEDITYTKGNPLTLRTVIDTLNTINDKKQAEIEASQQPEYAITSVSNFSILNDAFLKIRTNYYDSASLTDEGLIQGAIKGIADATGDKYTTYFPPVESKSFHDELNGQFEGIGAYVDMQAAGDLRVVSPLPGSPAEKAGLKGGDKILKIDAYEITTKSTLSDAVNKIKGPAGTIVNLSIDRSGEKLTIPVIRAKVVMKFADGKRLNNGDYYIQITTFGNGVADAFRDAVKKMIADGNHNKVIIDLRNNPGGSLDEVTNILNLFVPKDQSIVEIRLKNFNTDTNSVGDSLFDFSKVKLVILINEGSASASEIMAGTIKDYLPATTLVGVTSYGKGSVQTLEDYADGSSLKYTIAKWFTGKTKTGIDGVGIKPDIEVKFDETLFKQGIDNQLEAAEKL